MISIHGLSRVDGHHRPIAVLKHLLRQVSFAFLFRWVDMTLLSMLPCPDRKFDRLNFLQPRKKYPESNAQQCPTKSI